MMKFEHGALGLIAVLVAALISISLARPPAAGTKTPQAKLGAVFASDTEAAAGMQTAGGPAGDTMADAIARAKGATGETKEKFARGLEYDLEAVGAGRHAVPRLASATLPDDLAGVRENTLRKALFLKSILPLILQVNEEILQDRRRLWTLRYQMSLGQRLAAEDRLWLDMMWERYHVKPGKLDALIVKVDIIPPSLALAQAAEESGWGTSRFVREGNAIYGQWTWSTDSGIVPMERDDGKTHRVRTFASVIDSVRAYANNLNVHRSYKGLRKTRAVLRLVAAPLDGMVLAGKLGRYSERGAKYVETIRGLIATNNLRRLDDARLQDGKAKNPLI